MPAKAPSGVKNAHMFEAKMLENIIGSVFAQLWKTEAKNIVIGILFIMFARRKETRPTTITF